MVLFLLGTQSTMGLKCYACPYCPDPFDPEVMKKNVTDCPAPKVCYHGNYTVEDQEIGDINGVAKGCVEPKGGEYNCYKYKEKDSAGFICECNDADNCNLNWPKNPRYETPKKERATSPYVSSVYFHRACQYTVCVQVHKPKTGFYIFFKWKNNCS
ncbi:hypothetical protein HELRODRAFT_176992 [Helobdella robusta]|uniref:Uncharacterized protein n=1 Tax=Helobdella robusta TaxID=6412 RepID=T1FB38_HELRO|nr:hypothetical protein HELRODRAFT_176992 [Helobdella robusta]ESN98513.1 hypothetical protein HELRODRAFT_176992 [Helobdella robusta]